MNHFLITVGLWFGFWVSSRATESNRTIGDTAVGVGPCGRFVEQLQTELSRSPRG